MRMSNLETSAPRRNGRLKGVKKPMSLWSWEMIIIAILFSISVAMIF